MFFSVFSKISKLDEKPATVIGLLEFKSAWSWDDLFFVYDKSAKPYLVADMALTDADVQKQVRFTVLGRYVFSCTTSIKWQ